MQNYVGPAIAVIAQDAQIPVIVRITRRRNGLRDDTSAELRAAPGHDDGLLLNADELVIRLPDGEEAAFLAVGGQRIPGQTRLHLVAKG